MRETVRAAARNARNAKTAWQQQLYSEPGHFYSPISSAADNARAIGWLDEEPIGIDLAEDHQLALARLLSLSWAAPVSDRYEIGNNQYGVGDAVVLRSMLQHYRPKQILEVGSGYSTTIMLESDVDAEITCIEPYPDRLLSRLKPGDRDRFTLIQAGAQDVPIKRYLQLGDGDVLFIDSTHVVKAGSDVVWLFLHVLPRLAPGVLVHVHDIFWPFEYPQTWLEQRRDWTELYLLRALLTGSSMWGVELFSSWLWRMHPELVPAELRSPAPSNIWLRKMEGR